MHHEPLAKHPTILSLLGYGWQLSGGAPLPYIVVEFGESGSLRSWLRNKVHNDPSWLRNKMTLAGDVAAGLMALHNCGIVHGDLKLDNIIVFEGHLDRPVGIAAKIADFGHSILTTPEASQTATYYGTSL
jgi:serine/threonine protein kinase